MRCQRSRDIYLTNPSFSFMNGDLGGIVSPLAEHIYFLHTKMRTCGTEGEQFCFFICTLGLILMYCFGQNRVVWGKTFSSRRRHTCTYKNTVLMYLKFTVAGTVSSHIFCFVPLLVTSQNLTFAPLKVTSEHCYHNLKVPRSETPRFVCQICWQLFILKWHLTENLCQKCGDYCKNMCA